MMPVLFGVPLFAVLLAGVVLWLLAEDEAFEKKFPPISDVEFLARCRPGTAPAVALTVRKLVARHFAIEYARVHPSTDFVDDIGAD